MVKVKMYWQGLVAAAVISLTACGGESRSSEEQNGAETTHVTDSISFEAEKQKVTTPQGRVIAYGLLYRIGPLCRIAVGFAIMDTPEHVL